MGQTGRRCGPARHNQVVDHGALVGKGECDTGTFPWAIDTFIIRNGKIQRQTAWFGLVPKGEVVGQVGVEHMVLIKLKKDTTQEQTNALTEDLLGLKEKVPGIVEICAADHVAVVSEHIPNIEDLTVVDFEHEFDKRRENLIVKLSHRRWTGLIYADWLPLGRFKVF